MDRGSVQLSAGEGVALRVPLARLGERALALAIDAVIVAAAATLLAVTDIIVERWVPLALAAFVLRHAYFAGLTAAWQGSTVGKRVLGIQVVAIDGRLTLPRLLARSALRDLELGLVVLAVSGLWIGGRELWLAGATWLVAFATVPVFNPQRRRIADLLAGTVVVQRSTPDGPPLAVVDPRAVAAAPSTCAAGLVLGVAQMHMLARLLREVEPTTEAGQEVRRQVAQQLATKLGRCPEAAAESADFFLRDLYAELAAHHAVRVRVGGVPAWRQ